MKGLWRKEWYISKSIYLSCFLVVLILLVFKQIQVLPSVMIGLNTVACISSFAEDDKSKFLNYGTSLPSGIKGVVRMKYISLLTTFLVLVSLSLGLSFLFGRLFGLPLEIDFILGNTYGSGSMSIFLLAFLIPPSLRYGSQKTIPAAIGGVVTFTVVMFSIFFLSKKFGGTLEQILVYVVMPLIVLCTLYFSYRLSLKLLHSR